MGGGAQSPASVAVPLRHVPPPHSHPSSPSHFPAVDFGCQPCHSTLPTHPPTSKTQRPPTSRCRPLPPLSSVPVSLLLGFSSLFPVRCNTGVYIFSPTPSGYRTRMIAGACATPCPVFPTEIARGPPLTFSYEPRTKDEQLSSQTNNRDRAGLPCHCALPCLPRRSPLDASVRSSPCPCHHPDNGGISFNE